MNFVERFKNASSVAQFATFSLLFFILFLRVDHLNISVEKNVYDYYSESVIKDLDLNIINQVPDKERWQITKTGNWPDVHSNGIVTLWSPFFAYKSLMQNFLSADNRTLIFLTRSFATVFYSIVTILLTLFLLKEIFPGQKRFKIFLILSLSTSFWWFTFTQPGNADITSSVLAVLEIWIFFYLLKNWSTRTFFFFGLLLGLGLALKIDHVFYFILPIYFLIRLFKESSSFTLVIKNWIIFSSGVLITLIPMLINDSLKFGFVNYGYSDVVNFDYYVLWPNLFYPSGFINNCPIYFACFVGLLLLFSNTKKNLPMIIVGSIPFLALVFESFARIHHESYGARHWVPHFSIFAILLMSLLQKIEKRKWAKTFFYLFVIFAIGQNFVKGLSYSLNYEHFFFGENQWQETLNWLRHNDLRSLLSHIFKAPDLNLKLSFMFPLVLICAFLAQRLFKFFTSPQQNIVRLTSILAIYLSCSYLLITGLNLKFNQKNYEIYKQSGLFQKSIVGDGPNIQSLFENLGTYEKLLSFYRNRGNEERIEIIEASRRAYVKKAASEILYDPVGFKERLIESNGDFISDDIRED